MGALHDYNNAMLKGDPSQLKARTHATTEAGRKLQTICIANDAIVGKVLKLAKTKIDDKSASEIGQLLGDISNEELSQGSETINGDHAQISIPGHSAKTHMIRIDGQWKIDYDQNITSLPQPNQIDLILEQHGLKLKAAESLEKALSNDEVKSVDDAVNVLQQAIRRQVLDLNL